jgi:Skp family chaperone for outer membrane proteins
MVKDYEKPYVLTKFSKDFYDNPNKYESSLRKINDCLAKRYKDLSFDKIKEFVNKENLDIEIKKSLELREKAQANRHELNSRQKDIINNIVKICEIKDELNFYACLMG